MNTKHIILIIIILLTGVNSFAQVDTLPSIKSVDLTNITWHDLYVATTDGIFLRERPSIHAKAICSIPFGGKVQCSDQGLLYDKTEFDPSWKDARGAYWTVIRYAGQSGYAFRGYLRDSYTGKSKSDKSKVQLLFEGGHCMGDVFYNSDLHWYGYYLKTEGSYKYEVIKPVKVRITTFNPEYTESDIYISTDVKDESMFLFGLEKEIKEKRYGGQFPYNFWD